MILITLIFVTALHDMKMILCVLKQVAENITSNSQESLWFLVLNRIGTIYCSFLHTSLGLLWLWGHLRASDTFVKNFQCLVDQKNSILNSYWLNLTLCPPQMMWFQICDLDFTWHSFQDEFNKIWISSAQNFD